MNDLPLMGDRHPAQIFVDKAAELVEYGASLVGAVHTNSQAKLAIVGSLSCPWCDRIVLVSVLAADSEEGELVGGPLCLAVCEHRQLLKYLWSKAEAKTS